MISCFKASSILSKFIRNLGTEDVPDFWEELSLAGASA
jgi:hypothetical protein